MRLDEIASRLNCQLQGPGDIEITGVAGMDEAGPTEISFLANPKYSSKVGSTRAAAIILGADADAQGRPALRSENPYLSFARAIEIFSPRPKPKPGIHPTAVVADGVKVGKNASIGPYVVIEEGVEIGDECEIKSFVVIYHGAKIGNRFLAHAHAVVRENVSIGDDVILQNGAVVGGDGFGFARQSDGAYYKIIQAGVAVLEDGVEVQTNSCIDRATIGETRLKRGVKVDNLVQVGHGCEIGDNTLLCGQAGLAGTCKVGRNVVIAGQAGASGHLTIGDNAIVTPQSGVPSDVPPGKVVSGSPAIDHYSWLKWSAVYGKLPQLISTVRKLKEAVETDKPGN